MAASVPTPAGRAPLVPVVVLVGGAYLVWFGVHYWDTDTKYPTDPVKAVLTGKPIPAPTGATSAASVASNVESSQSTQTALTGPGAAGSAPSVAGAYSAQDLSNLWVSQGGSENTAFEAANVALAESSGIPSETSANPDGGINVGLWQLDTKGVGAGYTVEQLKDPATNARITIMNTANGTKWLQWADPVVVGGVYIGPKV